MKDIDPEVLASSAVVVLNLCRKFHLSPTTICSTPGLEWAWWSATTAEAARAEVREDGAVLVLDCHGVQREVPVPSQALLTDHNHVLKHVRPLVKSVATAQMQATARRRAAGRMAEAVQSVQEAHVEVRRAWLALEAALDQRTRATHRLEALSALVQD